MNPYYFFNPHSAIYNPQLKNRGQRAEIRGQRKREREMNPYYFFNPHSAIYNPQLKSVPCTSQRAAFLQRVDEQKTAPVSHFEFRVLIT